MIRDRPEETEYIEGMPIKGRMCTFSRIGDPCTGGHICAAQYGMYFDEPVWGFDGWWLEKWCVHPRRCGIYYESDGEPAYTECGENKDWVAFEKLLVNPMQIN